MYGDKALSSEIFKVAGENDSDDECSPNGKKHVKSLVKGGSMVKQAVAQSTLMTKVTDMIKMLKHSGVDQSCQTMHSGPLRAKKDKNRK